MHRHKFQQFVSAPGQRCYYFVVHISIIFVVQMCCFRGTEGNGQRAGVGDRTCIDTSSNHLRPVSGARTLHTCCKTKGACAPPLTYYGIPGTWYLVPGRQQRPISSCFSETRRAYHVPACTSLPPDTVDCATTETSWWEKKGWPQRRYPLTVQVHTSSMWELCDTLSATGRSYSAKI